MKNLWNWIDIVYQIRSHKLLIIMRLILLFSFINIFTITASTYSQSTKISLNIHQATLFEVFDEIESQTDFSIFYKNDQIDQSHKVDIKVRNKEVKSILKKALKNTGLDFELVNKHIVIIPDEVTHQSQASLNKQQPIVTGKATDDHGQPMVGLTVVVKGTTIGAITDLDGVYSIKVNSLEDTLLFSFVGYISQEIPIMGRTNINLSMKEDAIALVEVVAIGYGTKSKSDITGSVSVVNADELQALPLPTIDQALQGKATGVKVTQNTGAPGEGVAVRIRGIGTINDNSPLYIVDGIATKDAFNALSPNDIASISILKDASAAAIYGARAANGVVLITTKKGVKGAPRLAYNGYVGVQVHGNLTEMCNKDQYITLYNEAALADGRNIIPQSMADTLPNTNWWTEIFRPALIMNHQLSISGGNEKTNYLVSGTYFKQDGIILNSNFDRFSVKTSINTKLSKVFEYGINVNLSTLNSNLVGSSGDGYGGNGGSVVRYAFFRTPIYPVKNSNGEFIDYYPDYADVFGDGYNPVGFAEKYDWRKRSYRAFGNTFLAINILENLRFKTDLGLDFNSENSKRFNENWGTNNRINNPNSLENSSNNSTILTWNNTLSYNVLLNEKHNLDVLLGTEAVQSSTLGHLGYANNFPDQVYNLRYLSNGTGNQRVDGWESRWTLLSYFGRIGYNFRSKYYLDFILRRDGSSRFGANYPYGIFPSTSLGWRIDKEYFVQDIDFISHMKLRAGIGMLGNQQIGDYSFATLISGGIYYPFGNNTPQSGYRVTRLGNENIRWESQTQYNIGLDLGLWENMLFINVDYFNKITDDMLVRVPLPPSSGSASPPYMNAGKVKNTGLEFEVVFKQYKSNFSYDIGLVFSHYKNEVLELFDDKPIPAGRIDNGVYATLTEEGYPIGSFFLYEMEGIFQDDMDIITHAYQGADIQPGDVKYADVGGPEGIPDGIIDSYDRKHVGKAFPDFSYGLTGNFRYKGWDLSIFFEGVYGNDVYWQTAHDIEGFYRAFNLTTRVLDRWTGPGTSNEMPRVSWQGAANNKKPSTRFLHDGSYLRLKNLTLGYTFDKSFVSRIGVESLKTFISAQNILTITKYPGLDPEMQTSDNSTAEGDLAAGIDWGTYPSARVFSIGFNINF